MGKPPTNIDTGTGVDLPARTACPPVDHYTHDVSGSLQAVFVLTVTNRAVWSTVLNKKNPAHHHGSRGK